MKEFSILFGGALIFMVFLHQVGGAAFYVSKTGNNTTGTSWAAAWNELDRISWSAVNPGDTVKIGGGTYTTALSLSKAGTRTSRIYIVRAIEPGYDGKVTIKNRVTITQPYITMDGIDRDNFEFYAPNTTYLYVNIGNINDYFEIRNAFFRNTPDGSCWARCIDVVHGSLHIDRCEIYKSQCSEDIMRFTSSGSLKITHSYIHEWVALYLDYGGSTGYDWSHSDLVEGCGQYGCPMESLIVRYTIIDDYFPSTSTISGHNIAFMTGYTAFRYLEFSYNVVKDVYQSAQGYSVASSKCVNNVFYQSGFGPFGNVRNNIFDGDAGFYAGNSMSYCLWAPGTGSFISGSNNLQADPEFLDPANPLGADGILFTADDGFNIQSTSPAVNRGTNVGETADIRGNPLAGAPDIGAYEFTATGLPAADRGTRTGPAILPELPNPVAPAWLAAFVRAHKSLPVCDLAGKTVNDGNPLRPGVYLVQKADRSGVQKVFVVK